jgi:hypothetical protein
MAFFNEIANRDGIFVTQEEKNKCCFVVRRKNKKYIKFFGLE